MELLDKLNPEVDSVLQIRQQFRILKDAIASGEIGKDKDAYHLPPTGIPETDLAQSIRNSLAKGDNLEFALGLAKHFDRENISKVELFEIIKYDGTKYTLTTENILLHHQYHDEDELSPVNSFMKS